ncbi:MAG: hypothetical protein K6G47_13605 [Clostridia bacterium]|nr:hypothetical protein [Clostridia bacterium]
MGEFDEKEKNIQNILDPEKTREDVINGSKWQNLDPQVIEDEVKRIRLTVEGVTLAMSDIMNGETSYDEMYENLLNLFEFLSETGWLSLFLSENENEFPADLSSTFKLPETVNRLPDDQKRKYMTACKYWSGLKYMQPALNKVSELVTVFTLNDTAKNGFDILQCKTRFKRAGFDKAYYDKLYQAIFKLNSFLDMDYSDFRQRAKASMEYIEKNGYSEEDSELNRLKNDDYKKIVESEGTGFKDVFSYDSSGSYNIVTGYDTRAAAIDRVVETLKKVSFSSLIDKMKEALSLCSELGSMNIRAVGEYSPECSSFAVSVDEFIKASIKYAEEIEDSADGFKNKNNDAPYCYLKDIPRLNCSNLPLPNDGYENLLNNAIYALYDHQGRFFNSLM